MIDKLLPIYQPHRYKVLYGGRASGKSLAVADFLIMQTAFSRKMVLCCREFQSSIKDSVHKLLRERIYDLDLDAYFTITRDSIRSHAGSEFVFKGLRQHYQEIKSTQGIHYCWVEEAERVSSESWEVLKPTVREEHSEILITFNPDNEQNPTYQQFVLNPPPDAIVIKINYYENPFLPNVLLQEIEYDKLYNPDRFHHIWEGECSKMSNAVVFNGKFTVEAFDLDVHYGQEYFKDKRFSYRHGMDFGFSIDPTAVIESFVFDGNLYIINEIYNYHLDTDDIIPRIKELMPHAMSNRIFADSARPETISQLSHVRTHRDGYKLEALNIMPAIKGKGSVLDGIQYLKNFKQIIVHPRCKNTVFELSNYKYKVDKITGDIFAELEDKNNHLIDALRYAYNREIQAMKGNGKTTGSAVRAVQHIFGQ